MPELIGRSAAAGTMRSPKDAASMSSTKHASSPGIEHVSGLLHRTFMCGIANVEYINGYDYFMGVLTGFFCTTQVILFTLVFSNILEIFFYVGIFRHIGR